MIAALVLTVSPSERGTPRPLGNRQARLRAGRTANEGATCRFTR